MQQKYRPDIDGLRAVAVSLVLVFHAWPRLLPGGFVGVDVFFVISGYLITGIIFREASEGRFSYLDFYARRLRRIGPALLLVIACSLIFGLLVLPYGAVRELALEAAAGAGFFANFLFWYQADYFDAVNGAKPLLHLWSLGVEEQFYFIWPTLIVAAVAMRRGGSLPIVVPLLAVTAMSFALNIWLTEHYPQSAFYLLPGRLWQLGLGGILAVVKTREVSSSSVLRSVEAATGLAAIAASCVLFHELDAYPGWRSALPTIGAALVIDAGMDSSINARLLGSWIMRKIGLISYPIYLWHWPALIFLSMTLQPTSLLKAVALLATVVAAQLTYEYVEKPIRFSRARDNRSNRSPQIILGSLVGVALFSLFAPTLHLSIFDTPKWAVKFDIEKEQFRAAYRYENCFLARYQTARNFEADCFWQPQINRSKWLLWGDSHAAHLYPGLAAKANSEQFALAQLTASACPPIIGLPEFPAARNCPGINRAIESIITKDRPRVVVLAGAWNWHLGGAKAAVKPDNIADTVRWIRSQGVDTVYVVGPVPRWARPLPTLLAASGDNHLPEVFGNLSSAPFALEQTIKRAIIDAGAKYVSVLDALCDQTDGCLASAPAGQGRDPFCWDEDHFTAAGSILAIDRLWPQVSYRD